MKIIGISGKARSGKDTVAGLIKGYESGAIQYNLADPLKACVNEWLGWDVAHGYGNQKEVPQATRPSFESLVGYVVKHFPQHATPEQAVLVSEQMREEFEFFRHQAAHGTRELNRNTSKKDYFIVSPRQVYQWFGTEGMRKHVDDNIWLKLIPNVRLVILADVRFENEAEYVREHGHLIHVQREDCEEIAGHSSENGVKILLDSGDYLINNNSTIRNLDDSVFTFLDLHVTNSEDVEDVADDCDF